MKRYACIPTLLVAVACAGTETGNPPAEPIVEPMQGGEPDLDHTRYHFDTSSVDRGYAFGVVFTREALPADTQFVTASVLDTQGQVGDFTFEGDELVVGFNQSPPVVLRVQPVGLDGVYTSTDLLVAQDGSIDLHTPSLDCLRMSRTDLTFFPADVLEPIAVELVNDCESEQVFDWSVLGDVSLLDVLSTNPIAVASGGRATLEVFPAKNEQGSLTILLDPGGGLEQRRAISVRLLAP